MPATTNGNKSATLESLRQATYASFLASFVQGLTLLAAADGEFRWELDFTRVISIWRGGCIIRSEAISELLLSVYQSSTSTPTTSPLSHPKIASQFAKTFEPLKRTVLLATETDAYIPALSATLEWAKYSTAIKGLPTSFMEAELDFFGKHMFELTTEPDSGKPATGAWHFGWRPADGVPEAEKVAKQ